MLPLLIAVPYPSSHCSSLWFFLKLISVAFGWLIQPTEKNSSFPWKSLVAVYNWKNVNAPAVGVYPAHTVNEFQF